MSVPSGVPRIRTSASQEKQSNVPNSNSPTMPTETPRLSSRLLLILTAFPIFLAVFAFVLEWKGGGFPDPDVTDRLYGGHGVRLPGWESSLISSRPKVPKGNVQPCPEREPRQGHMFPHQRWHLEIKPKPGPKLVITTTTSSNIDQILPWLFYHKTLGVEVFLLFVEGAAATPASTAVLEAIRGVKIIFRTKELEEKQARSRIWNETWLSSFFYRPCNYELFVKQSLNMEMAIAMARDAGGDWILHIDTDELLYPAGSEEYSLQRLLGDVPREMDTVVFPNYESAVEQDDVTDPFTEVTMFKKNFDHVTKEVYFGHYREATRGNPNYFLTYGNGKSAARIKPHLRPNGAHRWHNYARPPREMKLPEAAVLHYTYARFSDLTSRRDRCGCKPNNEDVKRCFMLDFDRAAFIIASTQSEQGMLRWYREHVVWTDKETNLKLLKKGLFGRIYTPQIVVRGILTSGIIDETKALGAQAAAAMKLGRAAAQEGDTTEGVVRARVSDYVQMSRATNERAALKVKPETVEATAASSVANTTTPGAKAADTQDAQDAEDVQRFADKQKLRGREGLWKAPTKVGVETRRMAGHLDGGIETDKQTLKRVVRQMGDGLRRKMPLRSTVASNKGVTGRRRLMGSDRGEDGNGEAVFGESDEGGGDGGKMEGRGTAIRSGTPSDVQYVKGERTVVDKEQQSQVAASDTSSRPLVEEQVECEDHDCQLGKSGARRLLETGAWGVAMPPLPAPSWDSTE